MVITSKKQRKIICAQLIAAKPFLWDGTNAHTQARGYPGREVKANICGAIVLGRKVIQRLCIHVWYGEVPACRMIEERLGGHRYVTSFLEEIDGYREWLTKMNDSHKLEERDVQIQAYRLRWLESLIEEFSK